MKVVITHIGSSLFATGISVFLYELSNALLQSGHEVYVISGHETLKTQTNIRQTFDIEKLPTIIPLEVGTKELYSPKLDKTTIKILALWLTRGSHLIKSIKPDMLIVNGAIPMPSPSFKVVVCHDLEFRHRFQKVYDRIIYKTFDIVVATSTELAREVPTKLRVHPERVTVIPTCIDVNKYTVQPWERRDNAILHVGTWADKNLETTVQAFRRLAKIDPSIKLYVIGDLWERPKKLLSKVEKEFIKRIYCFGKVSKKEIRDLYSKVKVTSVPSLYSFPVLSPTVLESLASGTPVVGSQMAISNDLLIDGYNGFRVSPIDFNMISRRILMLLSDEELWNEFSKNSRFVAERFDANVVAKKYVRLHDSFKMS